MNHGKAIQSGTPVEVYNDPATPFVYDFLGDSNRLSGKISGGKIEIAGGIFDVPAGHWKDGDTLLAYTRPHLMMDHRTKVSPVCLKRDGAEALPRGTARPRRADDRCRRFAGGEDHPTAPSSVEFAAGRSSLRHTWRDGVLPR